MLVNGDLMIMPFSLTILFGYKGTTFDMEATPMLFFVVIIEFEYYFSIKNILKGATKVRHFLLKNRSKMPRL